MDRLCYTCGDQVTDHKAAQCGRAFCAARRDVEQERRREQGTRPPQPNEPKPTYYDDGGGA